MKPPLAVRQSCAPPPPRPLGLSGLDLQGGTKAAGLMERHARSRRTRFSASRILLVLVLLSLGTPAPPASPGVTHTAATLAAAQTSPPPTTLDLPTTPPLISRPPVRPAPPPAPRLFVDA